MLFKKMIFFDFFDKKVVKPRSKSIKKRRSAYGVYIKAGKILLIKSKLYNKWELPGGGLENNESLISALKREFKEETGYKIKEFQPQPFKVIHQYFYANNVDLFFDSYMNFFTVCKISKKMKSVLDNYEVSEVKMVNLDKLNKNDCKKQVYDIVQIIRSKNTYLPEE